MADIRVTDLKLRLCAIEMEALAAMTPSTSSTAYPRWTAKHDGEYPYWINRVFSLAAVEGYDVDYGEEMSVYEYVIATRLVVAHVTAEYEGEVSEALDEYLPQVVEYADSRELLQSDSYSTPMPYLIRASFAQGVGFNIFSPSPGGVQQLGAEFQWRCQFNRKLTQAYI
jgi:hypothetical protein